jgi:predicted ATPase/DNA-binding SARP family transcriptional activator
MTMSTAPSPFSADTQYRPQAAPQSPFASPTVELPVHLTRFVGRDSELVELARLLSGTRLLTLTGAGGSGKTRLARELAAHASTAFARVSWVDLASLTDSNLLAQEVATTLRVPDRIGAPLIESIVAAIGDSETLIVLDNCEHIVDACASLVDKLLRSCHRLRVVATSREALGIASETAWLVPPLAGLEAIQLFVERAQASMPSFTQTDANATSLADICRRLDGIPLAIELAAARVRVLSPEQISHRLDDAFRLLTAGSRTAIPRHRTLRNTMDWSYALLNEREQGLLRRLAVFSGTFSLEAAEDVCSGDALESEDILDGVAALVDKSLVVMEPGDGVARYRLLETVRQYGLDRLSEHNELTRYQARHAAHFLEFAERMGPHLVGGEDQPGLVSRMALEHDNLRAAAEWVTKEPSRADDALRFADALFWYWYGRGYWYGTGQFREAREYIATALDRAPNANAALRQRALLANGLNALAMGDYDDSRQSLEASLAIAREIGDAATLAFVTSKLGATLLMLGDMKGAMKHLDESRDLVAPMPPQMLHAFVNFWRGWGMLVNGDLEGARASCEASIALGHAINHRTVYGHASTVLGRVELACGNRNEAFVRFTESMRTHIEVGDGWGLQLDLEGLATLAIARGRFAEGVRIMASVDALRERIAVALLATEKPNRDRIAAEARAELGVDFDKYYEEGRTLSIEEVTVLTTDLGSMPTAEFRIPKPDEPAVAVAVPEMTPHLPTLRVLALGPLQVFSGNTLIDSTAWGSARPRELLVYLMMHPEGRTKEQVGLAFWPEASAAQLRNSFHVTLHRLRKALGTPEWITLTNDRYQVDPSVIAEFDVAVFEREVAEARRLLKRQAEGAVAALERALDRFRGDLLDGEPAGDWHLEHRDRLQRIYAEALMDLAARLAKEERYAKAADVYRRLLARDDLHEEAVCALMECHVKLGERAQAMRVYQRFAERLAKELDAEPDEETTEIFDRIRSGT